MFPKQHHLLFMCSLEGLLMYFNTYHKDSRQCPPKNTFAAELFADDQLPQLQSVVTLNPIVYIENAKGWVFRWGGYCATVKPIPCCWQGSGANSHACVLVQGHKAPLYMEHLPFSSSLTKQTVLLAQFFPWMASFEQIAWVWLVFTVKALLSSDCSDDIVSVYIAVKMYTSPSTDH